MSVSIQPWIHQARSQASALPGAGLPWLTARRERAIERFFSEGWPTNRHKDWRHTSLAFLQQQPFDGSPGGLTGFDLETVAKGQKGHWLVFMDGCYQPGSSRIGSLPAGVCLGSLATAIDSGNEILPAVLGEPEQDSRLADLNLALAGDGAFIQLPAGAVLDEPVHVVHIAVGERVARFTRSVVLLGTGASATVVEHYLGGVQGSTLTSTAVQGRLERGAHLVHLKLQQEPSDAFHLSTVNIQQEEGAHYESHSIALGARLARNDIATRLDGQHANVLLNGLFFADGKRHVDHHTSIDHARPSCTSQEYYRGIVADSAQGVFTGRIQVRPGADGTDAVQRSDNLLLSRVARITSQPELEIYADDVKCAHGATVGQIDEDGLFYLRSRGLSEAQARGVMTYAFAARALQRIQLEPVRKHIGATVRKLLPGGHLLGDVL